MECPRHYLRLRIDRRGRAHRIEDVPALKPMAAIAQKD